MVDNNSVLLIDVGNTRIKYATLDNYLHTVEALDDVSALTSILADRQHLTHIYLASVNDNTATDIISDYCQQNSIQLCEIHTQEQAFGITNSYKDVKKMGVDRWLAMVAAASLTNKAFVVIDIGTAITCDFVVDGQHLGGWIAPGFTTMRDGLLSKTKKVTANDTRPEQIMAGTDTENCVAMGCLAAVQGVCSRAIDYLSSKQTDFDVILGGGDKNMLTEVKTGGSIPVANLVVHGLARYAKSQLFA